ncbi:anti-sigma factor domain-containing protein [Mycobacterium sp. NPDC048908]|uniref:anti-sigma factor n=1 Tax=Mycobacterium sp. NPDC048908 TaxID=3364292 RepID=UPI0037199F8C
MTEPSEFQLLELATPYALDAVSDGERATIETRVAGASAAVAAAFDDEVRRVRETMAAVSASTSVEPPAALRGRLVAAVKSGSARRRRWRTIVLAAAAAIAIGLGALGAGLALRSTPPPSTPAQVFAAPDVRTVSGNMPGGGTATVVYSSEKNAGVLVMNNVPPPSPDTVYQMWLIGDNNAKLAGTMDAKSVAPSTTAVINEIGKSVALAFSVEPSPGSTQPTGPLIAELPLA